MLLVLFSQVILAILMLIIVFVANRILFQVFNYIWMFLTVFLVSTKFVTVYESLSFFEPTIGKYGQVLFAALFFFVPYFLIFFLVYWLSPRFRINHKKLLQKKKLLG